MLHKPSNRNPSRIGTFEHYLRTGQILADSSALSALERKFNPYHDPRNGQFTFAPGGVRSSSRVNLSHHESAPRQSEAVTRRMDRTAGLPDGEAQTMTVGPTPLPNVTGGVPLQQTPIQYRPNPRVRIGNNGGPPLNDPMTLQQVFPGLSSAPAGSILGLVDNILDITGPGQQLTSSLNTEHIGMLLRQIRSIDPKYRYDFAEPTLTLEGQINAIRQLRAERAAVLYRVKGNTKLLQVETLRFMQEKTDLAYDEAVHLYETGRLKPKLSRNEAIGNRVDRVVRRELRNFYRRLGIDPDRDKMVRVIGREYDSSGSDLTYRIPDARVGDVAFDVTLTQKTLSTPQVRGFFNADFQPAAAVIVRPTQLGPNNTYAIRRKDK